MGTTLSEEKIALYKDREARERERMRRYLASVELNHGERLSYDKDYLEALLFDDENGMKRIAFKSHDLSKLDLSEVSFEDVSYNGEDYPDLEEGEQIDLSNTNAFIDFSKSYEYKTTGRVFITSFDFHGTNLSLNNWHDLTQKCFGFIKNSNLSGTVTKLTDEGKKVYLKLNHVDLSDNYLEDISIDSATHISKFPEITFISCNLDRTGINISHRDEDTDGIKTQTKKKIMANPALKK